VKKMLLVLAVVAMLLSGRTRRVWRQWRGWAVHRRGEALDFRAALVSVPRFAPERRRFCCLAAFPAGEEPSAAAVACERETQRGEDAVPACAAGGAPGPRLPWPIISQKKSPSPLAWACVKRVRRPCKHERRVREGVKRRRWGLSEQHFAIPATLSFQTLRTPLTSEVRTEKVLTER